MSRSSKHTSRRPPKQAANSDASTDKDAAWGFGQDEDEQTINPRLGLVLTACLLLMFGFVLYNKYRQQTKQVAANLLNGAKQAVGELGEDASEEVDSDNVETAANTTPQTLASSTPTPAPDVQRSFNPFGESSEAEQETSTSSDLNTTPNSFNPFADEEVAASVPTQDSALPTQAEPLQFFDESASSPSDDAELDNLDLADNSSSPQPFEVTLDLAPTQPEPASSFPEDHDQFEPVPANNQIAEIEPEPDPFGLSSPLPEPQTPVEHQPEPAPLESMDLAMPLEPQDAEPDPFAGGGLEGTPSPAPTVESDPFGDIARVEEPQATAPPAGLTFPDDDWSEPTESQPIENPAGSFAQTESSRENPTLPALPDPTASNAAVADRDLGWMDTPSTDPQPHVESTSDFEPVFGDSETEGFSEQQFTDAPAASLSMTPAESVIGERQVTVTRNDSLWSIAQDAYGTARYVPALAQYNKDRIPHPDKLSLGVKVRVPPPEVLESRFPHMFRTTNRRDTMISPTGGLSEDSAISTQSGLLQDLEGRPLYRVGKNDTLSKIAQRYLGRSSRWTDILRMNSDRLKSPESLKPGMVLRLPAEASGVAVDSSNPFGR